MKKILALFAAILFLLPCLCGIAEESTQTIIIDKTKGENADFAFGEDEPLLEVFFPSIYGCDAALVRCGDDAMLIDCAGSQYKEVRAMFKHLGVTELTYAVNSHPDRDHIGGFNHILKEVPAEEFLLGFPEDYDSGDGVRFKVYEDLHAQGIPFHRVAHGESIVFGDASVTVYQRTDDHLPRVNNKSVTLMIQFGERRIYFTGDIQAGAQTLFGENEEGLDLHADILKFPHHGYQPMQESFLAQVSPALVIATSGESTTEGIKQLRDRSIPHLLTSHGALRLATNGKIWTVEKFKY
ncbi:MAG: MBL fold metallo-hydrolase [Clostridia bacterium]|nr:MBL fold metallo-hydrolase [Clostridia bacterium]